MPVKPTTSFEEYESAKKATSTKTKRGPVRSIRHERAENGIITHIEHDPPEQVGAKMNYAPGERRQVLHSTPEEAGSHLSVVFGGQPLITKSPERVREEKADGTDEMDD